MSELYESFLIGKGRTRPLDKWHHYFPIYERFFAPFRNQDLTLLEIGVQSGGSLQLWRRYFGPAARIAGIDVDPACAALAEPGLPIFVGDQADPAFLRRVLAEIGAPTLVIDDGGHTARQQITAFETIYPAMAERGVYVVEDTHTSFWPAYCDLPDGRTFLKHAMDRIAQLHDWTGNRANFAALGRPFGQRQDLPASDFCRSTDSIHFYDSVVVFQRAPREPPMRERR